MDLNQDRSRRTLQRMLVSINISQSRGEPKRAVDSAQITSQGIERDAHAGSWHRQISMLANEDIRDFEAEAGRAFQSGDFGENLNTSGINVQKLAFFDVLRIGSTAEIEVTQFGKTCHQQGCTISQQVGKCVMPQKGVFARVIKPGECRPGDEVVVLPSTASFMIITLSDSAASGAVHDASGPTLLQSLQTWSQATRFRCSFQREVIPDEPMMLERLLSDAKKSGATAVFTTGGTGIGPRDTTPETVTRFCDQLVPGIMEMIRARSFVSNPHAALSRSVAGVADKMLVFALPGSVRAVQEYMAGITPLLEDSLLMVRGIGH